MRGPLRGHSRGRSEAGRLPSLEGRDRAVANWRTRRLRQGACRPLSRPPARPARQPANRPPATRPHAGAPARLHARPPGRRPAACMAPKRRVAGAGRRRRAVGRARRISRLRSVGGRSGALKSRSAPARGPFARGRLSNRKGLGGRSEALCGGPLAHTRAAGRLEAAREGRSTPKAGRSLGRSLGSAIAHRGRLGARPRDGRPRAAVGRSGAARWRSSAARGALGAHTRRGARSARPRSEAARGPLVRPGTEKTPS